MALLIDREIQALCETGQIISSHYDPSLINPASIDIRVGEEIMVENEDGEFSSHYLHGKEKPYWLVPDEFVLLCSLETFNIPTNIAAEFKLKSSRAREGYNHNLAGWCDPGWHSSRLTMELKNIRRYKPLPLYSGLKIGQLILWTCNEPDRPYSVTGRYNGDRTVHASKG